MNAELALVVMLVSAFAALVTAHVTLAFGLLMRRPRWRGAVALFVAPLAPVWGWRERMRVRSVFWIVAAIVYGAALSLSALQSRGCGASAELSSSSPTSSSRAGSGSCSPW